MKEEVVKSLGFTKLSKEELNGLIETPPNPNMGDYSLPTFSLARKYKKKQCYFRSHH